MGGQEDPAANLRQDLQISAELSEAPVRGEVLPFAGAPFQEQHAGPALLDDDPDDCKLLCGKKLRCGVHNRFRRAGVQLRPDQDHDLSDTLRNVDSQVQLPVQTATPPPHAWKGDHASSVQMVACSAGRQSLSCTDFCSVADRNKRVAEALGIDRSTTAPDASEFEEYSDTLLRHAQANFSWAKGIEQQFATFVAEVTAPPPPADTASPPPRRTTLNFPPMKAPHRAFIHELCGHYGLASESVDVEPYRSVVVRKERLGVARIPAVTVTAAAALRKSTAAAAAAASAAAASRDLPAVPRLRPRPAVNALCLIGLRFGAAAGDLVPDLAAALGRLRYSLTWNVTPPDGIEPSGGTDAVLVTPMESSLPQEEIENVIYSAQRTLKSKLGSTGMLKAVECVYGGSWTGFSFELERVGCRVLDRTGALALPTSPAAPAAKPKSAMVSLNAFSAMKGLAAPPAPPAGAAPAGAVPAATGPAAEQENVLDSWEDALEMGEGE
ncbi:MAG: hypothetical protein BJ554DRAFT_5973 [Olpidium bornovanus]|uniref:R3H domain-containing protein n=1 Tax=Olpidium bornovanus TaxID=278681 RepID=A0A8H7ZYR8_9FUNG|nr:MAG: hypothetical protein BJ554DRAFT_5973 [Olpidium bornovanus]